LISIGFLFSVQASFFEEAVSYRLSALD